jgi:hypothetical protein
MIDAKALAAGLVRAVQAWVTPTLRSLDSRLAKTQQQQSSFEKRLAAIERKAADNQVAGK